MQLVSVRGVRQTGYRYSQRVRNAPLEGQPSDFWVAPPLSGPSGASAAVPGAGKELCLHILFVMVKVLRVPPSNPLMWQLSLTGNSCTGGTGGTSLCS